MSKIPAFQFYPKDWLGDTKLQLCSLEAQGLLIILMCHMHQSDWYGFLRSNGAKICPKNVQKLSRSSPKKFKKALQELLDGGVLVQGKCGVLICPRMVKDQIYRDKKVAEGMKGGNPNLVKDKDNLGLNQRLNPSSSSSSSSLKREKKEAYKKENTQHSFAQFWSGYPRKVARANAEKAWSKIAPDDLTVQRIIRHVEAMSRTDGWMQDGGRFIPHAATYLNGRRWEDDITIVKRKIGPEDPEWEIGSSMDHPNPNRRFC